MTLCEILHHCRKSLSLAQLGRVVRMMTSYVVDQASHGVWLVCGRAQLGMLWAESVAWTASCALPHISPLRPPPPSPSPTRASQRACGCASTWWSASTRSSSAPRAAPPPRPTRRWVVCPPDSLRTRGTSTLCDVFLPDRALCTLHPPDQNSSPMGAPHTPPSLRPLNSPASTAGTLQRPRVLCGQARSRRHTVPPTPRCCSHSPRPRPLLTPFSPHSWCSSRSSSASWPSPRAAPPNPHPCVGPSLPT